MNRTFFEELPARKAGGPVVSANTQKSSGEEGGNTQEKSAKRIRQAVYDIRYRARREDIDLKAAYSQYMGNTTMTGPEKDAVKQKLFGEAYSPIQKQIIANKEETIRKMKRTFEGPHHDQNKHGEPVGEELEEETKGEGANKKYKVRVVDKASGRTYIRFATREKINSLRANPNIESVEMTEYGQAYEGGDKAKKDHDGDGKIESPSKEHAGAVHNAIQRKKGGTPDGQDTRKEEVEQINEKPGDGYIMGTGIPFPGKRAEHIRKVNRKYDDLVRGSQDAARGKRRLHSAGALRPTSVGSPEYEAGYRSPGKYKPIEVKNSFEPEGEVVEAAPIPRTDVKYDKHMKQYVPTGGVPVRRARGGPALPGEPGRPGSGGSGRPLLPGEKPFPRLAKKKANTQMAGYEPEGEEISEREMTPCEKKKEGRLKDKYDESGMKDSMKKQYGDEKGKQVYFATIRKKAMESVEESMVSRSRRRELEKEMEGKKDKEQRTPFTTGQGARPYYTKKESNQLHDWRTQFLEQMGNEIDPETKKKVTETRVANKIKINPQQGTATA